MMHCGIKILKSAFQSTTLRTAGFSTIEQQEMTTAGKFISICYMFVGGSPASTSGGIKTTTLAVLVLCVISFIKGKNIKSEISFTILCCIKNSFFLRSRRIHTKATKSID